MSNILQMESERGVYITELNPASSMNKNVLALHGQCHAQISHMLHASTWTDARVTANIQLIYD
jgi:hypothetical protein